MRTMTMHNLDTLFNSLFDYDRTPARRMPAVDIRELDNSYIMEFDVPGLGEKDLDIQVKENLLTVSTKKQEEETNDAPKPVYVVKERHTPEFSRSFVLPKEADSEGIKATCRFGVLSLEIAKKPEAAPRSIEIKAE